jgi:hypothetical protein
VVKTLSQTKSLAINGNQVSSVNIQLMPRQAEKAQSAEDIMQRLSFA